jgi:hypothetical protein
MLADGFYGIEWELAWEKHAAVSPLSQRVECAIEDLLSRGNYAAVHEGLRRLGVRITINGNDLHVKAPGATFTPRLVALLSAHKQRLLGYLLEWTPPCEGSYLPSIVRHEPGVHGLTLKGFRTLNDRLRARRRSQP